MESMEGSESISRRDRREKEELRVKRKTLKAVLEQCQRALESLNNVDVDDEEDNDDDDDDDDDDDNIEDNDGKVGDYREDCVGSSSSCPDREAEELCVMLKSRVAGPDFIEKLESAQISVQQTVPEEGSSWDMVSDSDLWEGGTVDVDQDDYIVVQQEDIVDGIACFMAAYLLSLKQTKDLTPNQLQEALSKTFSVKKKKGKLQKALDSSKVIYNVASWSATAIGIYQNPALLRAASTAFWTSCRVISRLL